ncbi:hypothetical protein ACFQMA_19430 [Halosimplex aquaticum]|uniref:PQQ-like domain-containing protein n=1 Tax=Halosimplex aquaticum TaxID=3026162 RepID=A0ABD5Y8H1_9EURY|nr:hypothetical protein [Halosimplex aquaticum]
MTDSQDDSDWTEAETPLDLNLRDVAQTADGPYAVGTDGVVLGRRDGTWHIVVPVGPATKRNVLTSVDATADGERVWFAGSSGALGMYDTANRRKHDYSAPGGKTSTWEAIAVTGERGSERLLVANGSGEVLAATIGPDGCPRFGDVVKPGSGSTITGLDVGGDTVYAIDTSGNVFAKPVESVGDDPSGDPATDGEARSTAPDRSAEDEIEGHPCADGDTDGAAVDGTNDAEAGADDAADERPEDAEWREIGIRNAQVNFHDVTASGDRVLVAGDGGLVYRYDRVCENWTPVQAGDVALLGIDDDGERTVAVGANGSAFERRRGSYGWRPTPTPVSAQLRAVALGSPSVAVGADGTAIERGDDA